MDDLIQKRFWTKVIKQDYGCWIWTAAKLGKGYGQFWNGDVRMLAHRLSWEWHYGEIPPGLCVCHHCDNPSCVRPDHLFLGTIAENNRDMTAKGRARLPNLRGEQHPSAVLTEEQVLSILQDNRGRAFLAHKYGVHYNTISLIQRREKWKHLAC